MKNKTKRKRHTGAFKAKVGLEATMGVKTVGQIAREYQVHPVQVTQWKGVIRDRLPELFESPPRRAEDQQELIAQLAREDRATDGGGRTGLKKSASSWVCNDPARVGGTMRGLSIRRQCELMGISRSGFYYEPAGRGGEPGADAAIGRAAHGAARCMGAGG
jgi:transposase-like protein